MAGEMRRLSFMLIAGETSGDFLAAELVDALKKSTEVQALAFPPEFFGAGGTRMADAGVELALDLTRHSVIGLSEALKHYAQFKRIFDRLFQLAREREPDAIICVDFSGFNRRFAHAIKSFVRARRGTFVNWEPRIVQYVSPQVWASRPGRALQLERDLDLLLSIFPFEKEWYARRAPKLRVEFVGHPILDRRGIDVSPGARESARDEFMANRAPQILLLPGSRVGELRRHVPVMIAAARSIAETEPTARFKMVLPTRELKRLADEPSARLPTLEIQIGDVAGALRQTDLAIASTGTVTLECACFGVPTVAIYITSWSTYLIGRCIVQVKYLAMPNLLAGEEIFPEFIQHAATADNIARAALELLNHPERRKAVKSALAQTVRSLGEPGASPRAARAILRLLRR